MSEFEINCTPGTHEITSGNVLVCVETGRVVAVFYNDYDIENVVAALSKTEQLEQDNEALKTSLSLCQEQNKEMLGMLKELSRIFDSEYESVNIFKADAVRDLVTKIESRNKEGG